MRRKIATMKRKRAQDSYDDLLKDVSEIAKNLQGLSKQALKEYSLIVNQIIKSKNRNTNEIEHALDGLVSICGYEPAVKVFKKLCRYYWTIDQNATADYVKIYREMWD